LAISAGSADAVAQEAFGQGCSAGGYTPTIGLQGRPELGGEFALALSNAPPNTPALLVLGFSQHSLPLDYLGAVGCELLVWPDASIPTIVSPSGTADFWLYVPPDPTLIGLPIFGQWGVLGGSSLESLSMTAGVAFQILPIVPTPPCRGGIMLVWRSGWECIGGVWCFVDEIDWQCPDGSIQTTRSVQCTTDPCTSPSPVTHVITPVTHPSACDGAVLLQQSAGWECIDGVWCFVDKAKWRCPDGLEYETRVEQCTTDPCTPGTP
jgi:hypothetical protein